MILIIYGPVTEGHCLICDEISDLAEICSRCENGEAEYPTLTNNFGLQSLASGLQSLETQCVK